MNAYIEAAFAEGTEIFVGGTPVRHTTEGNDRHLVFDVVGSTCLARQKTEKKD